ncbi:LA_0364 family Cys-rich lipoprotein [Leptospira alexanderi]|uniref:LA_0364 family Cys-rich lipoprotein n=1 Tax=Leptospira alexanderi TaxID=100053 RepID=UPI000990DAE6
MKKLLILCLLFVIHCNEYNSSRQKCYEENACSTADKLCLLGAALARDFLKVSSTADKTQNPDFIILYSPLICNNAKQNCVNNCNAKHPF